MAEIRERPIIFSAPMVRAILAQPETAGGVPPKTKTRRPVKPQPMPEERIEWLTNIVGRPPAFAVTRAMSADVREIACPYGMPGDRLWVREAFWAKHDTEPQDYANSLDCGPCLDIGPEHHPGIQFVATPTCREPPQDGRAVEHHEGPDVPGDWWLGPPKDWDETEEDYQKRGRWMFLPWEPFSKFPSIFLPRQHARLRLEVVDVRVERLHAITEEDARAEGVTPLDQISPEQRLTTGERFGDAPHRAAFACLWDELHDDDGFSWSTNPWVWVVSFRRIGGAIPQLEE